MTLTVEYNAAVKTEVNTFEENVPAAHRLASVGDLYPELRKAEAQARLNLADAIMKMDTATDAGDLALIEQANVEVAKDIYTQALANLLRGEED